ncbi:MAG: hypothetical protein ACFFB3_09680, partial [Candidatus Hodarchaeota archaeon]
MKILVKKDRTELIEYLARKMDAATKTIIPSKQLTKRVESSCHLPFEVVREAIHQMVHRLGERIKLAMTGEASRNALLRMKKYANDFESEVAHAAEQLSESKTLFNYINAAGIEDLIQVRRHVEVPTLLRIMAKHLEYTDAPLRRALFIENFVLSMGDVGLISVMGEELYDIIRLVTRVETIEAGKNLKKYWGLRDLCECIFLTMKEKKKGLAFANLRNLMPNLSKH